LAPVQSPAAGKYGAKVEVTQLFAIIASIDNDSI